MTDEHNTPPPKGLPHNSELIDDAGQVHLAEPQMWGTGILADIKRTVGTWWLKEMTNFNQKTIAVSLLMFISIIPPTLAFGANYGKMSGQRIGAIETILATSWIGVAYSIIGGMPMCIIGSTGPALAISTAIKDIAGTMDVDYLTLNGWVSIWLLGYCFLCAFFDITRYVRLATRFTDEIFAMLIVIIFVFKAVGNPLSDAGLLWYLDPDHKTHEDQAQDYQYLSVALLGVILGFGTTSLIFFFRGFKFSPFFCNDAVRTSLHDFAVTLSVIIFTLIKELGFPDIQTEQLNVPSKFEPTFQCCTSACDSLWPDACPEVEAPYGTRSWFVDLADCPGWVPIAAAGPAIMAFLLVYLDDGITWHLINHKHNKITHGEAYNYDILLVGLFNCINGLLGLPWLVATTVPCIIHLNSLAEKDKDGHILEVQQTRLTMFFSHLLLGLSLLFIDALKVLPVPVLLGVFLFMGLSSLPPMEFWNRILLFFQQPSKYPETHYLKYMEAGRVHKYTCFQILFFFGIFIVMNVKSISIAFPFMTFLCIPGRLYLLPKFFAGWELSLLDGEEDQIERWVNAKEESIRTYKGNDITDEVSSNESDRNGRPAVVSTAVPAVEEELDV